MHNKPHKPARHVGTKSKSQLRKVIFLHIQKTAGSGIIETLRSEYGSNNIVSHGDYLAAVSHFPFEFRIFHQNLDKLHDIGAITGHFGFEFAERYINHRYSFTFLRDPIERILSFYYFCRTRDPQEFDIYRLCQNLDLNQFLSLASTDQTIRMFVWNNQAWQLFCGFGNQKNSMVTDFSENDILRGALVNVKRLSRIGFVETFASDKRAIFEDLGISAGHCNKLVNKSPCRPRFSDLNRSTQKTLMSLTELDRELYGAARRLDWHAVAN